MEILKNSFLMKNTFDDEYRRGRLLRIRKAIESRAKFEEATLEHAPDINSIRRIFHLQALWIMEEGELKKFGTVDYKKELEEFKKLKKRFADLFLLKMQRSNDRYYVLERGGKIYAFSTTVELFSNDIFILMRELDEFQYPEQLKSGDDKSPQKQKAFLESNNKLRA